MKRFLKIALLILLIILLLAGGILYLVTKSSWAQNKVVNYITNDLSKDLGVAISVEDVEFNLFEDFRIYGFYMEDLKGDTLVYVGELDAEVSVFDREKKTIHFSKLTLDQAVFNLNIAQGDSSSNIQFIIDKYFNPNGEKVDDKWKLSTSAIEVLNGRFKHDDFNKDRKRKLDVNHLDVNRINLLVDGIDVSDSGLKCNIDHLNLYESSGLIIENISSDITMSPVDLLFSSLELKTPASILSLEGQLQYEKDKYFQDFMNKVRLSIALRPGSLVNMSDVSYFTDKLQGSEEIVSMSGNIRGTVNRLKGKNLDLSFGERSSFQGNASFDGIDDFEHAFINFKVSKLITDYQDLKHLDFPFISKVFDVIPDRMNKLGKLYFDGRFTGFVGDFVAYGNLYTDLGPIHSNVALIRNSESKHYRIKGKVSTENFDIRTYTDNNNLGGITANVEIDATGPDFKKLSSDIKGTIASIDYKGYNYQNLSINGLLDQNLFEGKLSGEEPNLGFDFSGIVDLKEKEPSYDFRLLVNHANPKALNLSKKEGFNNITADVTSRLKGKSLDDLVGDAVINNLVLYSSTDSIVIDSFYVNLESYEDGMRRVSLKSDIIDFDMSGKFKYNQIKSGVLVLLEKVMPAWYTESYIDPKNTIDLDFQLTVKKSSDILSFAIPGLSISEGTHLRGNMDPYNDRFILEGHTDSVKWRGLDLLDMKLTAERYPEGAYLMFENAETIVSDKISFSNNIFTAILYNDTIESDLTWSNKGLNSSGYFSTITAFDDIDKGTVEFSPSEININNENWQITNPYQISFFKKEFSFDNLTIEKGLEKLVLNGLISDDPEKVLRVSFDEFQLSHINSFVKSEKFRIDGLLNSTASIRDVYNKTAIELDLDIDDIFLMGKEIGDIKADSYWDKKNNRINVSGLLSKENISILNLGGTYSPDNKKDKLDVVLEINELNLDILDLINASGISEYQGSATGSIKVGGVFSEPDLKGKLYLDKAGVKIDYLNTSYTFSDTVYIEKDWLGINRSEVLDEKGNIAYLNGTVIHENFRNWNYDFDADFENIYCFNIKKGMNEFFYGEGYANGTASIGGYKGVLSIEVNAKSNKGTSVDIPLGEEGDVKLENFVSFTNSNNKKKTKISTSSFVKILDLKLDVTRDAFVRLIFDEKIGDVIQGRGSGPITMKLDSRGDFSMVGNYVVDEGDYLFTLKNIVNKKFEVERGGTIQWFGDPYEALIDINAIYKVRASVSEFAKEFPQITQRNVMTYCEMKLGQRLLNPDIEFKISLPNLDPNTRSLISNRVNSEVELNRQFFSLLVLNKFLPSQSNAGDGGGISAVGAGVNTGMEFMANQISNWLSQISEGIDVDVNYRPGDQISNQELAVALSTQLFNERLQITGNLGVSDANEYTGAKTSLIGDFLLEYMLTPEGKFRLKVFNESNDFNIINTTQTGSKQGIGIVFHKDMDSILE